MFIAITAKTGSPFANGAGECVYEVEWNSIDRPTKMIAAVVAATAGLALTALIAPGLMIPAIAIAVVVAVAAAYGAVSDRRQRWRLLQDQLTGQAEATELLMDSMQDMVSALQLDEVLEKVTLNAQAAVGGAEFALLVESIVRNPYLNGENFRLDGALRFPPK